MRYTADHKRQTREKILKAASKRFRKGGGKGVAIADLMRDLRLTHGGFYRHFANKEELFEEAMKKAFDDASSMLIHAARNAEKGQELRSIIETYLSVAHCENSSQGCPVAAMVGDISRHPKSVRRTFDKALSYGITRIAGYMDGKTETERQKKALALFSGMAGALSLARAVGEEDLRNTILQSARESYILAFCKT